MLSAFYMYVEYTMLLFRIKYSFILCFIRLRSKQTLKPDNEFKDDVVTFASCFWHCPSQITITNGRYMSCLDISILTPILSFMSNQRFFVWRANKNCMCSWRCHQTAYNNVDNKIYNISKRRQYSKKCSLQRLEVLCTDDRTDAATIKTKILCR